MITKPKARKFRIRRSLAAPEADSSQPSGLGRAANARPLIPQPAGMSAIQSNTTGQTEDLADHIERRRAAARAELQGQVPIPDDSGPDFSELITTSPHAEAGPEIDAIRREGLTGRQLRMARRVAQKHGLAPTSDFDAVRLLRAEGIDPFQRSTMLDLVMPREDENEEETAPPRQPRDTAPVAPAGGTPIGRVQLPQTMPSGNPYLPSTETSPAERRTRDIMDIQRDIARRRRRKLVLLLTRLSAFVFLPTFLAGWYYFVHATPMYATKSEFLILQADAQGGSGLGGLLSGTQFATNQDSIAVQSYMQSRDAMLRLNEDMGFKAHFKQDWIDPIQRLEADATDEAAYKVYKKNVKIGYDPTEGVIRMEVIAADPQISAEFSSHLIQYAEDRVDELSRRKREDQMRDARASLEIAKADRREAQERLVALQEGSILDPQGEIASIRALINAVELQLQEKELALNSQLTNARPNAARVDALRSEVRLLRDDLDRQNRRLNDATEGQSSLAAMTAQIQMAQADLATADLFLQSALQNEKQTELEANRQVRYLTTSVRPVAPDEPTYPRAFENTILAFLIFSGIYLMISLTASILREQVSS
ncbi:MAG: capsule biosynthesis protein [Rhodobacterales bacterium]|nr:capsule biosynthesis protein [Rhodobacterales bacterium]MDX5391660.1 capsule biosynthesis protein [Rhodobacterales bacterium]MDX5491360.1 capsule biosynthesis protein [Rhodobacterales bacterium]